MSTSSNRVLRLAGTVFAASICGCAEFQTDFENYHTGWRTGWVEQVITRERLADAKASRDCVSTLSAAAPPNQLLAVIRYRDIRFAKRQLRVIPEGMQLAVGSKVRFDVQDCNEPIVPTS